MDTFKTAILEIINALIWTFDGNIQNANKILTMNITTDPIFSGVYTIANDISKGVIMPFAISVVGLCFFIEFIKISLKLNLFKWEYALSAMAKFAVAKAALEIAPAFILAIYRQGTFFITKTLNDHLNSGETYQMSSRVNGLLTELFAETKWHQTLALSATMSIIFLGIMIIGIFIVVMAYARAFEIIIYIAVAPLPVSFLPLENSQITKKFALNFAAVVLQGLIMVIILSLFNALVTSIFSVSKEVLFDGCKDMWQKVSYLSGTMLICTLTLVMAVMKSGQIAKSVLGQA